MCLFSCKWGIFCMALLACGCILLVQDAEFMSSAHTVRNLSPLSLSPAWEIWQDRHSPLQSACLQHGGRFLY